MLSPKRTKYRKPHRGRLKGKAMRGNKIAFGDFALQALEPGWITSRQIEAGRRSMSRYARRGGNFGFVFSLINPLQHVQLKHVWELEKEHLIIGWLL
jgi:ribosomal protein L16